MASEEVIIGRVAAQIREVRAAPGVTRLRLRVAHLAGAHRGGAHEFDSAGRHCGTPRRRMRFQV